MSPLSIWFFVVGIADLVAAPGGTVPSLRRATAAVIVAAAATPLLLLGSSSGLAWSSVAGVVVVVAGLVCVWMFGRRVAATPGAATLLLTLMGTVTLTVAATASLWPESDGGAILRWFEDLPYGFARHDPRQALAAASALPALMATSNAAVRLALDSIRVDLHGVQSPESKVRGGRLIGPIERLLIFLLAVSGEPTAAALIISAKGLLRFPELNHARTRHNGEGGIDTLTEYLLVGSLVSWSLALLPILLLP